MAYILTSYRNSKKILGAINSEFAELVSLFTLKEMNPLNTYKEGISFTEFQGRIKYLWETCGSLTQIGFFYLLILEQFRGGVGKSDFAGFYDISAVGKL